MRVNLEPLLAAVDIRTLGPALHGDARPFEIRHCPSVATTWSRPGCRTVNSSQMSTRLRQRMRQTSPSPNRQEHKKQMRSQPPSQVSATRPMPFRLPEFPPLSARTGTLDTGPNHCHVRRVVVLDVNRLLDASTRTQGYISSDFLA
jgi:hypothetical protein